MTLVYCAQDISAKHGQPPLRLACRADTVDGFSGPTLEKRDKRHGRTHWL